MILSAPEQAVPSFSCGTDGVVVAEAQMPVPTGASKNRVHSAGASGRCRARPRPCGWSVRRKPAPQRLRGGEVPAEVGRRACGQDPV